MKGRGSGVRAKRAALGAPDVRSLFNFGLLEKGEHYQRIQDF